MAGTDFPDLFLASSAAPEDTPILVFHYLDPADATLLRPLFEENLGSTQPLQRPLEAEEAPRLVAIAGAGAAPFARTLDRPIEIVVVVRDPQQWVVDHAGGSLDGDDLLARALDAPGTYSNAQSRTLLALFHDIDDFPATTGDDDAVWTNRVRALDGQVLLLTEQRLAQSVRAILEERFGWSADSVPKFGKKARGDDRLREALRETNWLDYELFRVASMPLKTANPAKLYRSMVLAATPPSAKEEGLLPLDVFFAREPLAPDEPSLVFQHIRKTAGTAFRSYLFERLHESCDFEPLFTPKDPPDMHAVHRQLLAGFGDEKRSRLLWAASHSANYLVEEFGRPVQPVTIVRDPLDRVMSKYFFAGSADKRASRSPELLARQLLEEASRTAGKATGLQDLANGQSRSLLEPYYDVTQLAVTVGEPADADLWRERLFVLTDDYVLLVQDELDASIAALGAAWRFGAAAVPLVRVNPDRPKPEDLPTSVRETVYSANWLDLELHTLAHARLAALRAEAGSRMKQKPLV